MRQRRRALSEVISTTILVAAMLIIVIGVMGFAIDLFNTQTQEAEFSQAQNGVVSLAQSVDSILPTQGSAAFTTFNARTGGPNFFPNFDKMTLSVNISTGLVCGTGLSATTTGTTTTMCSMSTPTGEFRYRAGSLVSYSGAQWLRGGSYTGQPFLTTFNQTLIIQNNSAPLGFVYVSREGGYTWVTMDYRRVNLNNMGIFNISQGVALNPNNPADPAGNPIYVGQFVPVNIVQINLVNVSGGTYSGGSNLVASVINQGSVRYSIVVNAPTDPNPSGKGLYNITVTFNLNKQSLLPGQIATVPTAKAMISVPYQFNGKSVNTIINIVVTNVQLSISGG